MTDSITIVTWNVNSLRARMDHVIRWLAEHRPHVVCLQETKVENHLFPLEPLQALGFNAVISGQKRYNGVAILADAPIEEVRFGFEGEDTDEQKRMISASIGGIRVVNVYVPQGGEVDSDKFAYKLDFLARLTSFFETGHDPDQHIVCVGDFNVAPEPEDVFGVEEMEGKVGFHPREREALERFRGWGFIDQFRKFESSPGFYSWWDYRQAAFRRNRGLRIDHIWATAPLSRLSGSCWMDREERTRERASDHIPVVATFKRGVD